MTPMKYLIILLLLASCSNFRPVYSNDKEFAEFLSNIEVEESETLESSEVQYQISKLFGESHDTKYTLKLTLTDSVKPLLITERANVVKQNVTQICHYILTDKSSGAKLTEGRIRLIGSYSSDAAPYVSYTNEKYTKKSVTQAGVEELRMRLMLYFEGHKKHE